MGEEVSHEDVKVRETFTGEAYLNAWDEGNDGVERSCRVVNRSTYVN